MSEQREIFNSNSLPKQSIEIEVNNRRDLFVYDQTVIYTGSLGSNPKGKKITHKSGDYIVKSLRFSDARGSVYDLMKAWDDQKSPRRGKTPQNES